MSGNLSAKPVNAKHTILPSFNAYDPSLSFLPASIAGKMAIDLIPTWVSASTSKY